MHQTQQSSSQRAKIDSQHPFNSLPTLPISNNYELKMTVQDLPLQWQKVFQHLEEQYNHIPSLRQVLKECAYLEPGEVFQPRWAVERILKTAGSITDKCALFENILSVCMSGSVYHRRASQLEDWHLYAISAILNTKFNDHFPKEEGEVLAWLSRTCGIDISSQVVRKLESAPFQTVIGFVLEYGRDNTEHHAYLQHKHLQYPIGIIWCDQQFSTTDIIMSAQEIYRLLQLTSVYSEFSLTEALNILLQSTATIEKEQAFEQVLLPLIDLLLCSDEELSWRLRTPVLSAEVRVEKVSGLNEKLYQAASNFIYSTLTRYLRLSMPSYPPTIISEGIDWTIRKSGCGCTDCRGISTFLRHPRRYKREMKNAISLHVVKWFTGARNKDGTVICKIDYDDSTAPLSITLTKQPLPDKATLQQHLKELADAANRQKEHWDEWHAQVQEIFRKIDQGTNGDSIRRLYPFLGEHYDAVMLCNPILLPFSALSCQEKILYRPRTPKRYSPQLLPTSQTSPHAQWHSSPPMHPDISDSDLSTPESGGTSDSMLLLYRVHSSNLLPETLDYFRIPWRPDDKSEGYLVIEQQISEVMLLDMFWHTQRIFDHVKELLVADGYGKY